VPADLEQSLPDDAAELVRRAAAGDQEAWNGLVDRYIGLIWAVARSFRLDQADAADVNQIVWLRLVEQIDRLRQPDRVGSWLAAVARNECLRLLRRSGREVPSDDDGAELVDLVAEAPDAPLLRRERDAELWRAFERLPARCQGLLRVLISDPSPRYEEVASGLGLPIGSIGPTRARCLDRLRRLSGRG
jgi:RNA polymerase sigma factor (sigma-70 family)